MIFPNARIELETPWSGQGALIIFGWVNIDMLILHGDSGARIKYAHVFVLN
jgi:hypothetical protein